MASQDDDFAHAPLALNPKQRLRAQFASAVAEVIDERRSAGTSGLNISSDFAAQLTEVAFDWATTALAPDLERFAKHGKRTKIAPEDVVLAGRKSSATHSALKRAAAELRSASAKRKAPPGETSSVLP